MLPTFVSTDTLTSFENMMNQNVCVVKHEGCHNCIYFRRNHSGLIETGYTRDKRLAIF